MPLQQRLRPLKAAPRVPVPNGHAAVPPVRLARLPLLAQVLVEGGKVLVVLLRWAMWSTHQ